MDQPRRARRGPGGDVVLLDEGSAHPARNGVQQRTRADDPATDDDDVPRLSRQCGHVGGPAIERREGRRWLVCQSLDHPSGVPGGRRAIRHSSQAVPTMSTTIASGVWKTTSWRFVGRTLVTMAAPIT